MRGWRSAFTLIELVVVMAIMVIMGALAPMITSGVVLERQMYNMAAQIQQDLLLVQNQAITYSSGGPSIAGGTRFVMRLYLAGVTSNTFAFQTTEGAAALPLSNPAPGTGIVVRKMSSTFGFPASLGKTSPASVTIGASPTVTTDYVDVVFDNQGLPYWATSVAPGVFTTVPTLGSIMLTNSSASKQIHVPVSQIGRVS